MALIGTALTAVSQVSEGDAGIASGVLDTTQQIGGSIGLAVLTTVSATVATNHVKDLLASGTPPEVAAGAAAVEGWTSAFQVSAGLAALAFLITLFAIKVTKEEAAHAGPVGVA